MEAFGDDGMTQARRCLAAMAGQDEMTRVALWKAAVRYHGKFRAMQEGLESARIAPARVEGGSPSRANGETG